MINIQDANFNISLDEFVSFYFKLVNKNLNHLGQHSKNVQMVAELIAENLKVKSHERLILKYGALLHDVGKTFVPGDILNASRNLTSVEFEIVKTHTMFGWEVLNSFSCIPAEMKMLALMHHYRNGYGYPKGSVHKISMNILLIDILTIADSFVAIMEPRVYKKPLNEIQAFLVINDPDNDRNAGLSCEVLDVLKYLIDNKKIILSDFF